MNIAVLEDENNVADTIISYLDKYFSAHNTSIRVSHFSNAYDLLESYENWQEFSSTAIVKGDAECIESGANVADFNRADETLNSRGGGYEILFLDIELPLMNGMEAAKKIREFDTNVIIIFVTNLAQYAVEGYGVNAFDFILKPIDYVGFCMKLDNICKELKHRSPGETVVIKAKTGLVCVNISDISYIEVSGHYLNYHTNHSNNKVIVARGTMLDAQKNFECHYFAQCNSCYLVNLAYVVEVGKDLLLSTGDKLAISQGKRKQFLSVLAKYVGGTI